MFQANRPYSYINVFDNLHKKIPKGRWTVRAITGAVLVDWWIVSCIASDRADAFFIIFYLGGGEETSLYY